MRVSWELPYASRREPAFGDDVVATSQPLAVQAGMTAFERGGNAVDAALAAAIALTVVEPTSNGIGGDAFALVSRDGTVYGLNASGRAPRRLQVDPLLGRPSMPLFGPATVTTPGAVSAWIALHERFGALPFERLFEPAIRWAGQGFPVSPLTADAWSRAPALYSGRADFAAAFLPGGRAPTAGERFALPAQASTLAEIADTYGDSFYRGALAERIAAHVRAEGGALSVEDLDAHRADWVTPMTSDHAGVTVHEIPPNGQGVAVLLALALLDDVGEAGSQHMEIEAMKAAFAEVAREVADPEAMRMPPGALIAPDRVRRLAVSLDPDRAGDPGSPPARGGGTVLVVSADRDGTVVSYIQSNYMGFGSGLVVPETGIALHNRGAGFATDPAHPNAITGGRRPFHTIIPGIVTRGRSPLLGFGVMGGPMQPQGHLQILRRMLLRGEGPQAAIDAPRWRLDGGAGTGVAAARDGAWRVVVEEGFDEEALSDLEQRGHDIVRERRWHGGFGGAQVALALERGGWAAASDARKDGHAAAR